MSADGRFNRMVFYIRPSWQLAFTISWEPMPDHV
eukprot:CAMPEP_0180442072 /NCGR_PEP_ID=MMETSP1036_2-20121128/13954_1 /TAXON_ID=632150 /ORGANISM="Azadinium spinosum, Strain 3D9" /LENGTH=33 /DNA_ID= /DNA_START= /DNA_END= /DNA_ORIENTATION=